jgi:hypothetical protein
MADVQSDATDRDRAPTPTYTNPRAVLIGWRGAWALAGLAMAASCGGPTRTAGARPASPRASIAERGIESAATPITAVAVARTGGSFSVSGCNIECTNCAGLDGQTYVVGTREGAAQPSFAGPSAPGAAYSCTTSVAVGETVTLSAHASPHYEFVRWELFAVVHPGRQWIRDYCPCVGSTHPVCSIVITPDVAAQYERAYCGAIWRQLGADVQVIAR